MLAVLRLVNDAFLDELVLPLCKAGALPVTQALAKVPALWDPARLDDVPVAALCARLSKQAAQTPLFAARDHGTSELLHRLLLGDWKQTQGVWRYAPEQVLYSGEWAQTLERALTLELPRFPYWDAGARAKERAELCEAPRKDLALASLILGLWEAAPGFSPRAALVGPRDEAEQSEDGSPAAGVWAYRTARAVRGWSLQLTAKLNRLLWREGERLKPIELPESTALLEHWQGKRAAPAVAVAFSGLGPEASAWIAQIFGLCRAIQEAVRTERGLLLQVEKPSDLGEALQRG